MAAAAAAAADEEDVRALNERVEKLSVSGQPMSDEPSVVKGENDAEENARNLDLGCPEPRLWGFETRELYKLALNFYKGEATLACRTFFGRHPETRARFRID